MIEKIKSIKPKKVTQKKLQQQQKKYPRSVDYQDELIKSLADHDHASAYLNGAIEESLKDGAESQALFFIALKNVAESQGNISNCASKRTK